MKSSLVATTVVIAILVSSVAGYIAGRSQTVTTTRQSTYTSFLTTTATSTLTYTATSAPATSIQTPPTVFNAESWNVAINGYAYPPSFVTFDTNSSTIYLSGAPSNLITVLDANTHELSSTFAVPGFYAGPILVDPKTNTLLVWADVCNNKPNATAATCNPTDINTTIVEVNGNTNGVIHVFPLNLGNPAVDIGTGTLYETRACPNPHGSVMDPDLPDCGFLVSYDLKSGSLLANISLKAPLADVAVNSRTNMIYLVLGASSSSFELMIMNGTTNKIVSETGLKFVTGPVLQVNPDTNTVFALGANQSSTLVDAIDGTDGRVLYSSVIGSACTVNSNRYYVNPFTNQVYATGSNSTLRTNYFLTIDASTGRLVNMLSTQGYYYEDSTYNPQLEEVYLLLNGQLVALPAQMHQTYVNPALLTESGCFNEPY